MATKGKGHINIDCGRLRKDYIRAIKNILGRDVSLMEVGIDDLSPIGLFQRHADQCPPCAAWEKEKRATILVPLSDG
jgi:hypothetical protein